MLKIKFSQIHAALNKLIAELIANKVLINENKTTKIINYHGSEFKLPDHVWEINDNDLDKLNSLKDYLEFEDDHKSEKAVG